MASEVTVCITCVGGHYIYDILRCLRSPGLTVKVIGVDADPKAKGRYLVDSFEEVPLAESDTDLYIERLLFVCEQYKVNALILTSESESRAVAGARERFTSQNIAVSVGKLKTVRLMTDKFLMLEALQKGGVNVGAFLPVSSFSEAQTAVRVLGYPKKKVVLKPRQSTGSRGVLFADATVPTFKYLLEDRFCGVGTLEVLSKEMEHHSMTFTEMLALPHYGDQAYDVDCVAQRGTAVTIVPRRREYQNPLSPVVEGCRIDLNPEIIHYVSQITKCFGTHGACDYDVALDYMGEPRLMDASCRPSGSCGATLDAGVNILHQLLRVMLDWPVKTDKPADGMRFRPFPHLARTSR